jgi:uncharacterized protein (DUF1800 family)
VTLRGETLVNTMKNPWVPFEPKTGDPWDLGKVAHLHRRAGFGATWGELERDLKAGPVSSVDRLLDPGEFTSPDRDAFDGLRDGVLNAADMQVERLKGYWLYRIVFGPDPLREKTTLFWHGKFATSNRKVQNVGRMLMQNELFRRHALGDFRELATAILADQAMLVWLDGAGSRKEKPNENLAREFLELFTLGVGHYTEADIRQAARALTGWVNDGREGDYAAPIRFEAVGFDGGVKTFLGRTGPWTARDIALITLEQPAAAEHLACKLYRFFVRDDEEPGPELIQPLVDEIRTHNFSIRHVLGVILRSRHFYSTEVRRHLIKSPVEWSAGLVHTLEIPRARADMVMLASICDRQGQSLFYPPNVKGWDGGRAWISSSTVLARANWAADLVWGNPSLAIEPFDAVAWAAGKGITLDHAVDCLADLLLQDDIAPEARTLAIDTGRDGRPDSLRKALQILLHCPECQLA